MSETTPCPFCGGESFPHFNTHIMISYTVVCSKCKASGPHIKINSEEQGRQRWEQFIDPYRREAISRWNERIAPARQDPFELPELTEEEPALVGC